MTRVHVADWFYRSFACRFAPGNLPMPSDALLGVRLRVQWQDEQGDWHDWARR